VDIRLNIHFQFEEITYPADILILTLSSIPKKFFYVVHIFDDYLLSEFSFRYIFITKDKEFLPIDTNTQREDVLIRSIQNAITTHKNNPFSY
jgi:hypothetical protein